MPDGSPEQRIDAIRDEQATAAGRETLDRARGRYGWIPNTIRVMARSPSAGELYLAAGELNERTGLSLVERELLAISTASYNGCDYCLVGCS